MKVRVYYEDTDTGGVVYHTNYIKYCERARSEIFFKQGKTPVFNDCHFVVSSLKCNFISPAKLGDIVDVQTKLLKLKNSTVILNQSIYLDNKKIFDMEIKLGFIDSSGKIQKIPEIVKKIFYL